MTARKGLNRTLDKKLKKRLLGIALIIVVALAFVLIDNIRDTMFGPENPASYEDGEDAGSTEAGGDAAAGENAGDTFDAENRTPLYKVERVVDGDTIIIRIDGTRERVRLIGLDAPESVHADESKNTEEGRLASEFTKGMLEGQKVSLEFDVQERDKYGRILAYVYLGDEMFNEILIREGHAQAITYSPNVKYQERFRQIQKERDANK